ncbi:MAG: NADPH-dependent 7-cyano-7-deazaguanine reductase QueF [FCB group bacterium]|nr:NADPH-dependent 7-cyano-7-deazaguanine reductase QueF [FCB group bacterium]
MNDNSEYNGLSALGGDSRPSKKLEVFPNRNPERDYIVTLSSNEFTCLCPITGQPDFASVTIEYIPDEFIVESKSLKLYFWSFRDEGVFHEHVANRILDDLVAVLQPRWCRIITDFGIRGGIAISIDAEYTSSE